MTKTKLFAKQLSWSQIQNKFDLNKIKYVDIS